MKAKIDTRAKDYIEQLIISQEFQKIILKIRIMFLPDRGLDVSVLDGLIVDDIYPRIPKQITDVDKFNNSINNLLLQYGFSHEWFELFSDYVLFDFIGNTEDKKQMFLLNLGNSNTNREETLDSLKEITYQNPIAILLPPFASQRDIYDFISINWEAIEKIQKSTTIS